MIAWAIAIAIVLNALGVFAIRLATFGYCVCDNKKS